MIGKEVFFIEDNRVVAGIVVEVCNEKRSKKYSCIFFDYEGDVKKRILIDSKYSDDIFGFSYEEFIKKIKEKTENEKDEFKQLRREFENY